MPLIEFFKNLFAIFLMFKLVMSMKNMTKKFLRCFFCQLLTSVHFNKSELHITKTHAEKSFDEILQCEM